MLSQLRFNSIRVLRKLGNLASSGNKQSTKILVPQFSYRFINVSSKSNQLFLGAEEQVAHGVLTNTRDKFVLAGESLCKDDLNLDHFLSALNLTSARTCEEILETFQILSDYANKESIDICSNIFDKFIDLLTDNLRNMDSQQLCEVFKHLRKWPLAESTKTRNFIEIWTALDDTLKDRCEIWNTHELVLFLDNIYRSNLIRNFLFTKYALSKLIRKAKNLTPAQIVQVSFYAGCQRWKHDMFDLEMRFFDCIDFLTLEEIGVVCMGFFKTQTPFRDPHLVQTIMKRLQQTEHIPHSILIASILKMIKYSMREECNFELQKMYDWFINHMDDISPMACTHLAISGVTSRLRHPQLLSKLAVKLKENADTIRLKDLERIGGAYSLFNIEVIENIPIFDIIIEQLRHPNREKEIQKHASAFVNCLMYLAVVGKFPLDLISLALDPEFIEKFYAPHMNSGKSLHIVNNAVAIECKKKYKGSFLSEAQQSRLSKKYFRYVPEKGNKYKMNTEQMGMFDIMSVIANHRGDWKYMKAMHFLPHFDKGDIVLCNSVNKNPIKVENYFPKKEFGHTYEVPDKSKSWATIVATGPQGSIWNTSEPIGLIVMKMRQLKAIGYTPVHIPLLEWQQLKSTVEKVDYLKKTLAKVDFLF